MVTQEKWDSLRRKSGAVVIREINGFTLPCIARLRSSYDEEVSEIYIEVETYSFYYGFGEDGIKRRYYKSEYEYVDMVR